MRIPIHRRASPLVLILVASTYFTFTAKAQRLTKAQRAATARKKVAGSKKGKQFVSNTPKAKVRCRE
jgi:hypothetical protein